MSTNNPVLTFNQNFSSKKLCYSYLLGRARYREHSLYDQSVYKLVETNATTPT